jgi:hypothetical protein
MTRLLWIGTGMTIMVYTLLLCGVYAMPDVRKWGL